MTPLQDTLVRVPAVYAELGDALLPVRSGEPSDTSPDPRHRPAPGRLDVADHRHQLVKGLRWWVDAVRERGEHTQVGHSVPLMSAWLLGHLDVMAPEDRAELFKNLLEWLAGAAGVVGYVRTPTPPLPLEALDRVVPVHVAAKALGVSVSTVKRRAPGREGGRVKLRDVAGPECVQSDLPMAWCAHCRPGV